MSSMMEEDSASEIGRCSPPSIFPSPGVVKRISKNYFKYLTFWWFLKLNSVELKPLLHWIFIQVKDHWTWIRIKEIHKYSPKKNPLTLHLDTTIGLSPELSLTDFLVLSVMMVSQGASKQRAIFCRSCCDPFALRLNIVMR